MLTVGTAAPDIEIQTHTGYQGPLSHFWQNGPLILFFYPKDQTSICTKQACMMQDNLGEFATFEAEVLGASTDGKASHQAFAEAQGFQFPLIIDKGGQLAKRYQAFRGLLRVSKRMTYVIDQAGIITGCVHHEFSVRPHLEMIRKVLQK